MSRQFKMAGAAITGAGVGFVASEDGDLVIKMAPDKRVERGRAPEEGVSWGQIRYGFRSSAWERGGRTRSFERWKGWRENVMLM